MLKTKERFPIVRVNKHTLLIDENIIHNTVSIQRATLAPEKATASSTHSPLSIPNRAEEPDTRETPTEYAVYRILRHDGKDTLLQYEARWYGCSLQIPVTCSNHLKISPNIYPSILEGKNKMWTTKKEVTRGRDPSTYFGTIGHINSTRATFVRVKMEPIGGKVRKLLIHLFNPCLSCLHINSMYVVR